MGDISMATQNKLVDVAVQKQKELEVVDTKRKHEKHHSVSSSCETNQRS